MRESMSDKEHYVKLNLRALMAVPPLIPWRMRMSAYHDQPEARGDPASPNHGLARDTTSRSAHSCPHRTHATPVPGLMASERITNASTATALSPLAITGLMSSSEIRGCRASSSDTLTSVLASTSGLTAGIPR